MNTVVTTNARSLPQKGCGRPSYISQVIKVQHYLFNIYMTKEGVGKAWVIQIERERQTVLVFYLEIYREFWFFIFS
jgi:hypothetical protein